MLDTAVGRLRTRFRDVLFQEPGGVIRNRARVSKWGLGLAKVDIALRRSQPGRP
jgi:hypothetical protein